MLATSVASALLAQRAQEAEEKPLTSLGMTPKQASGTAEASQGKVAQPWGAGGSQETAEQRVPPTLTALKAFPK